MTDKKINGNSCPDPCQIRYYIEWYPFFWIIDKEQISLLEEIIAETCRQYGYRVAGLEIKQDSIYITVNVGPTVAPCDVVRTLKSVSAAELVRRDPAIRKFYRIQGTVWNRECIISTSEQHKRKEEE